MSTTEATGDPTMFDRAMQDAVDSAPAADIRERLREIHQLALARRDV